MQQNHSQILNLIFTNPVIGQQFLDFVKENSVSLYNNITALASSFNNQSNLTSINFTSPAKTSSNDKDIMFLFLIGFGTLFAMAIVTKIINSFIPPKKDDEIESTGNKKRDFKIVSRIKDSTSEIIPTITAEEMAQNMVRYGNKDLAKNLIEHIRERQMNEPLKSHLHVDSKALAYHMKNNIRVVDTSKMTPDEVKNFIEKENNKGNRVIASLKKDRDGNYHAL